MTIEQKRELAACRTMGGIVAFNLVDVMRITGCSESAALKMLDALIASGEAEELPAAPGSIRWFRFQKEKARSA